MTSYEVFGTNEVQDDEDWAVHTIEAEEKRSGLEEEGLESRAAREQSSEKEEYRKRRTMILLAGGSGSRMNSDVAKQYMELNGKPILWYSLQAIEESEIIDDCILVVGEADIAYAREEIVKKYHFTKVKVITAGGAERYASVEHALQLIGNGQLPVPNESGYVFIHDAARPFLTEEILRDTYEAVCEYHACTAAVPSKDTVKIADTEGFALSTPDRRSVWQIQTPQVFDTQLILQAHERLKARLPRLVEQGIAVTDDAGVVEMFTETRVKLVEASYRNIKITTPEDLVIASTLLHD